MIFTGLSARGETIVYEDGKRYLWILSLLLPFVPIISYGIYFLSGSTAATLIPVLFVFGLIPLLDAALGEDFNNPPAEVIAALEADPYYRRLALATVPLFWLSYLAAVAFVGTQDLPWWSYLALILGVGTINGGAIALGHELGHKPPRSVHGLSGQQRRWLRPFPRRAQPRSPHLGCDPRRSRQRPLR